MMKKNLPISKVNEKEYRNLIKDADSEVDAFGMDTSILKSKKLFLLDMDGTIYEEDKLFDGTVQLLSEIKNQGGRYVFITNNSSKSVKDYVSKVNTLGIEAERDDFFTSTQATILYLKQQHPGKTVYCMGTKSMIKELTDAGISVVTEKCEAIGVVLLGFDTELTFEKIRTTSELLTKDLPYIATNPDYVCPVNFGFVPDCGAISKMLAYAVKKEPIFIGKPEPAMVEFVMDKYGYKKEKTVVIGDRLYTDIAAGLNADVTAVCVLTGEASLADIKNSEKKPTLTMSGVKEIYQVIKRKNEPKKH